MNIANVMKLEDGSISATIDGVAKIFPDDMANRHRRLIADWESDGNTIGAYVEPPKPFAPLPRAAFLYMAKKLGLDDASVRGLIAKMPATTQAEINTKDLALLVYENQQTFERENSLLKTLVAKTPLTAKQVDAAWREGEQIKW